MSAFVRQFPRDTLINALLILISAADAAVTALTEDRRTLAIVCGAISVVALCFRHNAPYLAFLATVPALFLASLAIAPLVALAAVAEKRPARVPLAGCMAIVFVCYSADSFWEKDYPATLTLQDVIYAALYAGAPVLLGLLLRTRAELSAKIIEIDHARRDQQQLMVDQALARERADLAREMHDVVSHQVSLIAVQAGALQVTATDAASIQTARTIRMLSVRTLDELRDMVGVLRASGSGHALGLTPQPGIADIDELVAASGIDATITTEDLTEVDPSPAVQRAMYRVVQEGLTNIRKHAPGASACLHVGLKDGRVEVTLINTPPTRTPALFPSDQNGLLGLRERAELLGGSLHSRHLIGGGHELSVQLPPHTLLTAKDS